MKKMTVEDLTRNGVRVIRRRFFDKKGQLLGSTVEANCDCYGLENRMHTTQWCTRIPKGEPSGSNREEVE